MKVIVPWIDIWDTALWTAVGIILVMMGFRILAWVSPFNFRREIEKGNPAAGVVAAGMLIAVAVLVGLVIPR